MTITDTDDIIFRLAYFERQHNFYTTEDLTKEMMRHYTSQAIKQAYVIIFGLDVIGNPFGLVVGVTRSVEDLFYEPFQGAVEGPSEFAEGLVIGNVQQNKFCTSDVLFIFPQIHFFTTKIENSNFTFEKKS